MTLSFDSPGHLERRIAAQMAADQSDDSSFGLSRKAASMASMSFSTEDESYMRAGLGYGQSTQGASRSAAASSNSTSQAGALSPRNMNVPGASGGRTTLIDALAASSKGERSDGLTLKSSMASTSKSSVDGQSDTRVRSPPLTSTPHPAQATKPRRTSFHKDAGLYKDSVMSLQEGGATDTLSLSFASAKDQSRPRPASRTTDLANSQDFRLSELSSDQVQETKEASRANTSVLDPLRESDLPETSSYFRSKVLGERFEASMAGDESLSEAIIQRRPTIGTPSAPVSNKDSTSPTVEPTAIIARKAHVADKPTIDYKSINTPKPSRTNDMEHMKAYVLSSVKATNPLRQAQLRHMTPGGVKGGRYTFANNHNTTVASTLSRRHTAGSDDDKSREVDQVSIAPSVASEVSSTNDLTVPAKFAMRANTSLPGVEEVEMGSAGNARVDPRRLQHLLHKINEQLEAEVAELRAEKEDLQTQFDRALLDCERLRKQNEARERSTSPSNGSPSDSELVQRLEREIRELKEANSAHQREGSQNGRRLAQLEADLHAERLARNEDEELYRIEVQALTDDRERLKRQLDDDRAAARAEIERIKATAVAQQSRANGAGDVSSTTHVDVDHYEQIITELRESNAQMAESCEEREALHEDYEALDQDYQQTKADLEEMRDELNEAKDRVADLEIALSERENEILKLDFKLSNQSETLELRKAKEQVLMLETTLAMTREAAAREAQKYIDASIANMSNGRQGTPVHPSIAALRKPVETPRSPPAGELSSASWMQSLETLGEAAIRRDLSGVRHDLEDAQREVDQRIAQLGEKGLFKQLISAQETIERLQVQLDEAHAARPQNSFRRTQSSGSRDDRGVQHGEWDKSVLARSTTSMRNNEQMMQVVAGELENLKKAWAKDVNHCQAERQALEEEKEDVARTQRAIDVRRAEAKERARRQQADTLAGLSKARRLVAELERGFVEDVAALELLKSKDEDANRALDMLSFELQRTKVKMQEIDRELNAKRTTFERLEHEMQERSQVDESLAMNVHGLHQDTARFSQEMQRLREERHAVLQVREKIFAQRATSHQQRLSAQEDLRGAREALAAHQRQLDEQVETIEWLHEQLSQQSKALDGAQADRDRLFDQRREILVDVAQLENDLRRVRDESKRFGADLDGLQRLRSSLRTEVARETKAASEKDQHHHYHEDVDARLIEMAKDQVKREQRSTERHQAECRGLLLQIRYEKAKYMRESDLRQDLVHQKQYLLGIVGGLRLSDKATAKFLADLRLSRGHAPAASDNLRAQPLQRFRAAANVVMAICRARRMANNWRSTVDIKRALRKAHTEAKEAASAQTQKTRERTSSRDVQLLI